MIEGAALVRGDMLGLVAPDLILGVVPGRAMRVALVVEVAGMDGDDGSRHPPGFRVRAHVVADLESLCHLSGSSQSSGQWRRANGYLPNLFETTVQTHARTSAPVIFPRKLTDGGNIQGIRREWRRGRDSNPRYGCPYSAFRVRCDQ